jgi:serine/threonine protein kinase
MATHHHHLNTYQNDSLLRRIFFNKYQPDKKLGEGSFGKIYSAKNINTGERFALKMVRLI